MDNDPYVAAKFKVWAVVTTDSGDILFEDIVSASASFKLNDIPTASLVVAVGKNPITEKFATIHEAKNRMQPRDKVIIKLTVTEGGGNKSKLQEGTYTIFDGYFVGIGYQRSGNHANYVLNLVHWLDDLNNSSAINGNWFPGVPHDYAQNAAATRIGETTALGPAPGIEAELSSYDNITTDMWENVLKPLFLAVAGFSGNLIESADPELDTNAAAIAALERMPGPQAAASGYYKPLKLYVGNRAGVNIEGSFGAYLTATSGTAFVNSSFWSKLITEYGAQFLFAIAPTVSWAAPIPFCAGLRWQTGGKIIHADEYNYASFNSSMSQMIESITISYPIGSATNAGNVSDGDPNSRDLNFYAPYAQYPSVAELAATGATQVRRGLKLFKLAPGWIANTDGSAYTGGASADDCTTAVAPIAPITQLPANVVPSSTAVAAAMSTVERFAQHWYLTEVLQQRYGELSGPLRFDIAPGSIIKVATPARDKSYSPQPSPDNPQEYVIASVLSVSYVINAERATAGTSFAIAHIKSEHESTLDFYSTSAPPLYTGDTFDPADGWQGAPLAEPDGPFVGDINTGGNPIV